MWSARSPQIIEFMFGTPYRVNHLDGRDIDDVFPIAVVGARTSRNCELLLQGRVDAFTITFQPGGLAALFSIPAIELTDRDFDGTTVLDSGISELYSRLAGVCTFTDRVRVADDYLMTRSAAVNPISNTAKAAVHVMHNNGCVRVEDLARAAGLGARQLERRFRHEIGMGPKMYCRVIRFEAALKLKAVSPSMRWTQIAHALGYHDQMHMVHDFKRLAGVNPTGICDQLDMFVRPEVICAERPTRKHLPPVDQHKHPRLETERIPT
jgi:AraC-like DNA-binding protein